MKFKNIMGALLGALFITCNILTTSNKKFVILIASYNNEKWCRWNLRSALNQLYDNFRIIYIDDCSQDRTGQIVQHIIKASDDHRRIAYIRNTERCGALANHYRAIHELCADDEIVVILDGDDALAHSRVLEHLNKIYSSEDIWLTYGQYRELTTQDIGFSRTPPEWILNENAFRKWELMPSHLRTFYAWLFKKIEKKDLITEDGKFFTMTGDMAIMMPLIEMARYHFKFIPQVLYIYNNTNPISDHCVSREMQSKIDKHIRSLKPYVAL